MAFKNLRSSLQASALAGLVGVLALNTGCEEAVTLEIRDEHNKKVSYQGSKRQIAKCLKDNHNLRVFLIYDLVKTNAPLDLYAEGKIGDKYCEIVSNVNLYDDCYTNGVGKLPSGMRVEELD